MNLFGQSAGGSPLDFTTYGIAGLIIAGWLLGWMWSKPAVDKIEAQHRQEFERLRADYERVVTQRDALYGVMEDKVVPALLESTTVTAAMRPVMEQVVRVLDEVRPAVEPQRGRDA